MSPGDTIQADFGDTTTGPRIVTGVVERIETRRTPWNIPGPRETHHAVFRVTSVPDGWPLKHIGTLFETTIG